MKLLGILRDSLREALDSKVLYFLLALSLLVIVGVASIAYQPKPADKGLAAILERFPGGRFQMGFSSAPGPVRYELQDFQQLNSAPPWEGDYRFQIVVREVPMPGRDGKPESTEGLFPTLVWLDSLQTEEEKLSPEDREARKRLLSLREQAQNVPPEAVKKFLDDKMRDEITRVSPAQMERFVRQQLAAHGDLDTTSVKLLSSADKEYRFAVEARGRPDTYTTWPHSVTYLFGAIRSSEETAIGPSVFGVESGLVGTYGAGIAMLVATIVTAFFIPHMLHKGAIDLLLAKPIRRSTLLVYKFLGGLTFIFINTAFVVVGIWLVVGLRSGLWAPNFLLIIFTLTFEFAIFYAVSTLFGVLTRSPILSILMTCITWFILWAVGSGYQIVEATREFDFLPRWLTTTADVAHFVLPRYKDIDALNAQVIARGLLPAESPPRKAMDRLFGSIQWGQSLGFTAAFIALMLGLASWRFATKDY